MKINASINWPIAVVACFVLGCASDKQPSSQQVAGAPPGQPEPGKGLVIFYRESKFTGGGVPFRILEATTRPPTKIVDLSNGRYFAYSAAPGKYNFVGTTSSTVPTFFGDGKETVTAAYFCPMTIESNTTYYAHAEMNLRGLVGEARLSRVDAGKGSEAIKKLRRQ